MHVSSYLLKIASRISCIFSNAISLYVVYSMAATVLSSITSARTCPRKILCAPIPVCVLCFAMLSAMNNELIALATKIFFGFFSVTLFVFLSEDFFVSMLQRHLSNYIFFFVGDNAHSTF